MMSDADIEKFKPGRRFATTLTPSVWRIDSANITDSFIYITDDSGYSTTMSIDDFDKFHYFLDDLPVGWGPDWTEMENPMYPIKCQCGSDSYYGVDQGAHSDYCPKYKK